MDLWMKYAREKDMYLASFSFDSNEELSTVTMTWLDLLKKLATYLKTFPQVGLILFRTDHPTSIPSRVAEREVELFRTDPVQAIRNWTAQNVTEAALLTPIPVGYEVLPDAFGDSIYLRFHADCVESPFTGDMIPVELEDDGWIRNAPFGLPMEQVNPRWVTCSTKDILNGGGERFFIPRGWNPHPPWISFDELSKRYETYLKEKSETHE